MLLTSFILFAITAFLGLCMAGIREGRRRNPPAWLTMFHGLPAAAGLTLLMYAAFAFGIPRLAIAALILFLVAAGGGATLNLVYQQRGQLLPRWLMRDPLHGRSPAARERCTRPETDAVACRRAPTGSLS